MRYVVGRVWTRPGKRDQFLERSAAYTATSRGEPGCVYYDMGPMHGDPNGVILIECWESAQTHAAHLTQPQRAAIGPIFEEHVLRATFEEMDVEGITPIVVDLSTP
jgi:quinol monooxygenase YgiN